MSVNGASSVVVDVFSKKIHQQSAAQSRRSVGGLTKIATALVALNWAGTNPGSLAQMVTITPESNAGTINNPVGLQIGDTASLRDMISAAVMASDDTAANALAEHVGKQLGGGTDHFVGEMKKLATSLGMTKTHFSNPSGSESCTSTALDMGRLAIKASTNPAFRFYCNQHERNISVIRNGLPQQIKVTNTNQLLGTDGIDSLAASDGGVIISAEQKPTTAPDGNGNQLLFRHRLIAVVLDGSDKFGMARELLKQGWDVYFAWLQAGRPVQKPEELLNIQPTSKH